MTASEARETATFGALLRHYRLAAGLSQETLAERARLSVNAIAALERGRRITPRLETVTLLAEALNLTGEERAALVAAATGTAVRTAPPQPTPSRSTPAAPVALAPLSSLPLPPTALVGREHEEATVAHLLRQPHEPVRLLTLVGPGGVGKTRLALAVAASLRAAYQDGVVFVDLSPLRDVALVAPTIARALGLPDGGARDAHELLLAQLQAMRLLLVLDNFEQVVDAAPLVADLVAACPHLAVLVTSRTALRVRAEQRFSVPPLSTPAEGEATEEDVAGYAAVRLFMARAQAVHPDFTLDGGNARIVAEICRRLDGVPLAIELAAAHVALLPPAALLTRLERRLPLLKWSAQDVPERQRTLRAALDWSFDLLDDGERRLFARMAVCVGGCTLDAAATICDPEGTLEALDVVASLVDKSLIQHTAGGGEPRLGMLETIREYGLERLEARGEVEALRRAHAAYFLALAEAAEPHLYGPDKATWLARLEREHDNLRAALMWALASEDRPDLMRPAGRGHTEIDAYATERSVPIPRREIGLRLAAALWRFWHIHGYLNEGRSWVERLLAADEGECGGAPSAARAAVLAGAGWLAQSQDDFAGAMTFFEQSVALRRALGQPGGMTDLLVNGALMARSQGDYARARALLEESLALHRAQGDRGTIGRGGLGLSLFRLAMVSREQGDYARAVPLYEECLALHRAAGDREGVAMVLLGLGGIARAQGDAAQVRGFCEESLAIFQDLGQVWGMGFSLNNLALAAYGEGALERAEELATQSVTLFRGMGVEANIAEALVTLAYIVGARGNDRRAWAALAESLALAWAKGPRYVVAAALEGLAALIGARGQAERAARLLGTAAALRAALGVPLSEFRRADYERGVSAVRAALGDDAFAAARAAGEALPLEQAISTALDAT